VCVTDVLIAAVVAMACIIGVLILTVGIVFIKRLILHFHLNHNNYLLFNRHTFMMYVY